MSVVVSDSPWKSHVTHTIAGATHTGTRTLNTGPQRVDALLKPAIAPLLEAESIQYTDKYQQFFFTMSTKRVPEEAELFTQIARLNNRWWTEASDDD